MPGCCCCCCAGGGIEKRLTGTVGLCVAKRPALGCCGGGDSGACGGARCCCCAKRLLDAEGGAVNKPPPEGGAPKRAALGVCEYCCCDGAVAGKDANNPALGACGAPSC